MRKLLLSIAFLTGILVFQSCSKQSPDTAVAPLVTNIVHATVAANGSYQMRIETSGAVNISKQASHFKVSQTEADSKNEFTVYRYVPVADYRGSDEVVLSNTKTIVTRGECSDNRTGNSENITSVTSYTTVRINVTD